MTNRRVRPKKPETQTKRNRKKAAPSARREVGTIIFGALGILTLLALTNYNPQDSSLNAAKSTQIHNWIGPIGSYWSDLLFQFLGIGAYALALGLLLAASRCALGRNLRPGSREVLGTSIGEFGVRGDRQFS